MPHLSDIRADKPRSYPDQAIYAEYACATLGPRFQEIDGGTGLLFEVSSMGKRLVFGAGRCSYYPQNNATAASIASDKYFANTLLERDGVATLGGAYFFLHDRHRAFRPAGHERIDALRYFDGMGGSAFVKPLRGSHGDFAQAIDSAADLSRYLDAVSLYYDAILIQPIVGGSEYRIFILDGEVLYSARKYPPRIVGDGTHTIRELLAARQLRLATRGVSSVPASTERLDTVLAEGQDWEVPGPMNRSAGGSMRLEKPAAGQTAFALAGRAAKTLGLRAAAVDLFADIEGVVETVRIIEVNANPAIRFLEDSGRSDLILKIWHHTLTATGLLGV